MKPFAFAELAARLEALVRRRYGQANSQLLIGQNHSGLGLAIVQTSVELLGGTCRAHLSEGNLRIAVLWNQK